MTEITYEAFLSSSDSRGCQESPVYLIHGDEYRADDVCERLLRHLVGQDSRDHIVERFEGGDEVVVQAIDHLNTYALLADRKIVVLPHAGFFWGRQDTAAILKSAANAYNKDEKRRSALLVMKYLALTSLRLDDPETPAALAGAVKGEDGADAWIAEVLSYSRAQGLSPPTGGDSPADRLAAALSNGFPAGHVLIITAETVDKRKRIYKAIAEDGLVIDCRIPSGDRMADRKVQAQALAETADRLLKAAGKSLAPEARKLLNDRVGCDLRRYAGNIEKLITYAGERSVITAADVRHLVPRTRQEPIYALTTAVAERDAAVAVVLLRQMVADESIHPLQAMAALGNQVRRLIVARQFIDSPHARGWRKDLPYPGFTQHVMPDLLEWQSALDTDFGGLWPTAAGGGKKNGALPAATRPFQKN